MRIEHVKFRLDQQQVCVDRIKSAYKSLVSVGITMISQHRVDARLQALEEEWNRFVIVNDAILMSLRAVETSERVQLEQHHYFKNDIYNKTYQNYLDAVEKISALTGNYSKSRHLTSDLVHETSAAVQQHTTAPSNYQSRLPRIDLPKFNGSFDEWLPFRDLFTSLVIDNTAISSVEKLQYLKTSLEGSAAQLIKNTQLTSENFQKAWEVIISFYENKRILVKSAVSSLFNIKKMKRESAADLNQLFTSTLQAYSTLETLRCPVQYWDDIIVHMTVERFDAQLVRSWENHLGASQVPPTWNQLLEFIKIKLLAMQSYENASRTVMPSQHRPHHYHTHCVTKPQGNQENRWSCPCCGKRHSLSKCSHFQSKTVKQRRDFVQSKKLCYNCLGQHFSTICNSSHRCMKCGAKHHTLIHQVQLRTPGSLNQQSTIVSNGKAGPSESKQQSGSQVNHVHRLSFNQPSIILATAQLNIYDDFKSNVKIRALFDQGSEVSLVSERLVQCLKFKRESSSLPILGIGAQKSGTTKGVVTLIIKPYFKSSVTVSIRAYILPRLTTTIPSKQYALPQWDHLTGLTLADPQYSSPGVIDLIIGADYYGQLLEDSVIHGPKGSPTAQLTKFGWIISGPVITYDDHKVLPINHCQLDSDLNNLLEKFWRQEEVSSSIDRRLSTQDQECEDHFVSSHSRDRSGRYIVRLPFKIDPAQLGNSKHSAIKMLYCLQTKFTLDDELRKAYFSFISEYEKLNHMIRVPANKLEPTVSFHIPHHGVIKESSLTTKLRVVFNGSCRVTNGITLNEALHSGPKLQVNLFDVLLWMRRYKYIFASDIEKMYRQIKIHPDDRRFQKIYWKEEEKLIEYELTTVTYGLSCAPFLALRTLLQLLDDDGDQYPLAVEILQKGRYVDDVFGGGDSIEEAQERAQQVYNLCMAGGFPLRKWTSNHPNILKPIPKEHQIITKMKTIKDQEIYALGLSWNPSTDNFKFDMATSTSSNETKRTVLSKIAQYFDPLGFLSPLFIRAKVFVQELWVLKIGWDDPLEDPQLQKWKRFLNSIEELDSISIPRWISLDSKSNIEIHGFSDASQVAMAAVIYIKATRGSDVQIRFLCSKTKVAPLKRVTIPRLELMAAVMLSKLTAQCRHILDLNNTPCYLWTDSTTVLVWINNHPSRWKEFVHNRVCVIQELLPHAHWRFVPGIVNPADCATRGLTSKELQNHSLWWSGPSWLKSDSRSWPPGSTCSTTTSYQTEERRLINTARVSKQPQCHSWIILDNYSSIHKLIRVTATCQRAIKCFKRQAKSLFCQPLTPEEINTAQCYWIKIIQGQFFSKEIQQLKQQLDIPKGSSLIKLTPFIDNQGLLRVGGRLNNSALAMDTKHPYILPRNTHFSLLLVQEAHQKTFHGSTQDTLIYLRNKFWILGGRTSVRSVILKCPRCTRYRRSQAKQLMGQLPYSRVNPSRAFLSTGVDYAGPYTIKTWKGRAAKTYKAWISLFVCMTTSAVHMELVSDYSTEAFISAYKRFTSRRGICSTLHSDCGSNFKGANTQMQELFSQNSQQLKEIASLIANDGTKWLFNPPAAPHFGGKWEAAVKSLKHHLRRVVGDTQLTYEEFTTLLNQIEAVLNSRPLCPLTDDPDDLDVLTPGHFLIGHSPTVIPEPCLQHLNSSTLSRWQHISQMVQGFWNKWSKEYLQRFYAVYKWNKIEQALKPGDIVLIIDERYPPAKWPLGRILQVHPGKDGLIRVATVKTTTTSVLRPIAKLCPLPTATSPDDSSPMSTKAGGNV